MSVCVCAHTNYEGMKSYKAFFKVKRNITNDVVIVFNSE